MILWLDGKGDFEDLLELDVVAAEFWSYSFELKGGSKSDIWDPCHIRKDSISIVNISYKTHLLFVML